MEDNVNKVASWEDVINNNFNAPETQAEEQAQEVAEEVADVVAEVTPEEEVISSPDTIETETVAETTAVDEQAKEVGQDWLNVISELDPNKQALIDAILSGQEDLVYDYLIQKNTDYNQVNDLDIIKGKIASDNPDWDEDDIQLEIEAKYGAGITSEKINLEEIDKDLYPEEYKEAVKINKEIERSEKLLKRDAKETRSFLEKNKNELSLPTPEKRLIDQIKESNKSVEQPAISEADIQRMQQEWVAAVERDVPNVSEFKFKLGDEDVSYKITQDEQKQLVDKMKTFNAESYLVERGWVNEDGTANLKRITEDVYILENNEKIFKSGWTQSKEKAKMDLISKDIKNINLDGPTNTVDVSSGNPYAFGDYILSL